MNLRLLYLVLVIYSVNVGILVTIIPLYSNSIGANEMVVGLIVSTYAIAYVAASPLWGKASDLLGRKLALGLGMLGCSAVIPLFSIAADPNQLVLIRLFQGFADASFWIVPTIIVADVCGPSERGMALGKIGTFQGMGFIIGPLLGGLLSEQLGYSYLFYICSGLAFLTALLVFFGLQKMSKVKDEDSYKVRPRFKAVATKSFTIAYFHTVLSAVFFGVIVSQFVLHADEILGKEYLVGFLLTGYYIVETFIQPAAGKLSDSIGRHWTILLAFVACAFGFAMLILTSSFVSFSIAIMIIGGGIGGLYVSLTALLMDAASSSQRGLVAGIQNIAWGIGYFIGPAVGGIAATSSFSATYMLCIIASIIGGTLTLISQYRISTD
ncbi:MAG: MFS transporter [Candidatus Bathyarchaeota archaeon]|jgi:MFS family permease